MTTDNMQEQGLVSPIKRYRWLLATAATLLFAGSAYTLLGGMREDRVPVGLTGVQHLGPDYNIADFYVDGYSGGNVGRGGGGGSLACCVTLPARWRPGMTADVRWAINDWTHEKPEQIAIGNYSSVKSGGMYRARVPVEPYNEPAQLYVHFFSGGRVRVLPGPGKRHDLPDPLLFGDPQAAASAVTGRPIADMFSADELAEMARQYAKHKRKYGDWR